MSLPKGGVPGADGPPRRLIETGARADGEAWGVDLLRDAEPTSSSSFRKQRIRAALGQRIVRRAPFALRPAIIVGVLGAAAVASAALGHWPRWIQNTYRQMTATETTGLKAKAVRPISARHAEDVATELPVVAEADVRPEVSPAGGVTRDEPSAATVTLARPFRARRADARASAAARRASRLALAHETPGTLARETSAVPALAVARSEAPTPRETSSQSVSPPQAPRAKAITAARSTEDTAAVSQATRALRIDRDPVLARSLAKHYLDQYPSGSLAEEALAISIEAAAVHHDADAATLAARYLRLYPSGSFRARAQRAAASP